MLLRLAISCKWCIYRSSVFLGEIGIEDSVKKTYVSDVQVLRRIYGAGAAGDILPPFYRDLGDADV